MNVAARWALETCCVEWTPHRIRAEIIWCPRLRFLVTVSIPLRTVTGGFESRGPGRHGIQRTTARGAGGECHRPRCLHVHAPLPIPSKIPKISTLRHEIPSKLSWRACSSCAWLMFTPHHKHIPSEAQTRRTLTLPHCPCPSRVASNAPPLTRYWCRFTYTRTDSPARLSPRPHTRAAFVGASFGFAAELTKHTKKDNWDVCRGQGRPRRSRSTEHFSSSDPLILGT